MSATDQAWLLAFVVTPAIVALGGYVVSEYWIRRLRRDREERRLRLHPGE